MFLKQRHFDWEMSQRSLFTDTFCKDVIMAENRILEVFFLTFPVYPCKTALTNTVRLRSEDGLTLKTTVSFETLNGSQFTLSTQLIISNYRPKGKTTTVTTHQNVKDS